MSWVWINECDVATSYISSLKESINCVSFIFLSLYAVECVVCSFKKIVDYLITIGSLLKHIIFLFACHNLFLARALMRKIFYAFNSFVVFFSGCQFWVWRFSVIDHVLIGTCSYNYVLLKIKESVHFLWK